MKKYFETFIYILLVFVIVVRFYGAYQEQKRHRSAVLEPTATPNFTWRDFESDKHTLRDIKGKTIVLHFWAAWCGPCREEFPGLLQTAKELEKDVVFLTISGDEEDKPAKKFLVGAKTMAGVAPNNVLYGFDPMKSIIFDIFQTTAFPETIIIDANYNMRRKLVGLQNWRDPKIINYLRDIKPAPLAPAAHDAEVPKAP